MKRDRHVRALSIVAALAAAVDAGAVAAEPVRAVEYYHQAFGHYFVTSNALEIAGLDQGSTWGGWSRTGQRYFVDVAPGSGRVPVCRFFTAAFANKASHFFTANAAECEWVKANPHWTFESVAFHAIPADAQVGCPAGTTAVHRLYNNGQGGAPNHAYTVAATQAELLASLGWAREGTAFCVPVSTDNPATRLQVLAGATWNLPVDDFDFGPSFIQTTFASTVKVDGSFDGTLAEFGLPLATAAIAHTASASAAWEGIAVFDPVSASYVVAGRAEFEPPVYLGNEWTFESAAGVTVATCSHVVFHNYSPPVSTTPHPFQPTLRDGCRPRVAQRR